MPAASFGDQNGFRRLLGTATGWATGARFSTAGTAGIERGDGAGSNVVFAGGGAGAGAGGSFLGASLIASDPAGAGAPGAAVVPPQQLSQVLQQSFERWKKPRNRPNRLP
jgi:hypothetical protein